MDRSLFLISYPLFSVSNLSTNFILSIIDSQRYPLKFKVAFKETHLVPKYHPFVDLLQTGSNKNIYSQDDCYASLDAPHNVKPIKKFSDVSGLPAYYKDILTTLQFSDISEYISIQNMPIEFSHLYLSLRLNTL